MVFSSLTFLYFYLPAVLLIYFLTPKRGKNMIILLSGLLFYAWGEPIYVIIMVLSTLIDYTAGRVMHHFDQDEKKRTLCLLISVVMNLGLLAVFKYGSFFITNLNGLLGASIPDPQLPLPIGISFYTFQSMSYTIDLYRRNIKVQRSFVDFAAYVTLFPQIVAGPIVRYGEVAKELRRRTINVNKIGDGIGIFVCGLAKKVLLANNIGAVWTQVKAMDYTEISTLTAWIGILAFTFQIYFDFSGYSDMAVGLGKMLGFRFPKNFDHPYLSRSISEFWRRWHITLGSWFRSYVYIPLGGNRKGLPRTILNLMIVWALTGMWHGASWNFILWGLYFGVLIVIERLGWGKILARLPCVVSTLYTFLLVIFGWILFDTSTLAGAGQYFFALFGATGVGFDSASLYLLSSSAVVFVVCILASTDLWRWLLITLRRWGDMGKSVVIWAAPAVQLAVMLVCTAYLVTSTYNPFLYSRF